jgi:hypothetical protein
MTVATEVDLKNKRILWACATVLCLTIAIFPQIQAAAGLPTCNLQEQVFVRSSSDSNSTKGTQNNILVPSSIQLDNDCQSVYVGTAFTSRTGPGGSGFGDWVEIGFQKFRDANGNTFLCRFTEWGTNFNPQGGTTNCSSAITLGTYDTWKVSNVAGTNDWKMQVDYLDGNGLHDVDTVSRTYNTGIAAGETERRGSQSDFGQSQRSLMYKNTSNNFVNWPNSNCIYDDSQNWGWRKNSATSYDVIQTSNACS